MGPLVPDVISNELNLIIGFFIGIAFGYVLEQAGFSSSRKLAGLFYGTDFTVLRVFFTAGITAAIGVILLGDFGLLDTEIIFINPTYLYSAIVGGAIMGVGFVVGGYCPGTSFCGAAIGKIDAMVFVAGGYLGVLLFAEGFPLFKDFYEAGFYGFITVDSVLGVAKGAFVLILTAVAITAFVITARMERKINPASPASSFPARRHRIAAIVMLIAAFMVSALPDYKTRLVSRVSDEEFRREHPVRLMDADELAFRIVDHDPLLVPIDVRSESDFSSNGLPGAVSIPIEGLFGKEWRGTLAPSRKKKVFYAATEKEAADAALTAGLLGYENIYVLRGGLNQFNDMILNPRPPSGNKAPHERDTYRFRLKASEQIVELMKKRSAPVVPEKKVKKVQGGCGV